MDADSSEVKTLIEIHLKEFEVLKGEQIHRIQFRDNQIYANIGATGAVALYALGSGSGSIAFLAIPWVNILLGWIYLFNDQKVSALGQYFRNDLGRRLLEAIGASGATKQALRWGMSEALCEHPVLFGWEVAHRADSKRKLRKKIQLAVDLLAFVVPGFVAIALYHLTSAGQPIAANPKLLAWVIGIIEVSEAILLSLLAYAICMTSDFGMGAKR